MKKRLVHRNTIRWGWIITIISVFVFFLIILYSYYFLSLILLILKFPVTWHKLFVILTIIPIIALLFIFFPVYKTFFYRIFKRSEFLLFTSGIQINHAFIEWKNIKSISFYTGRTGDEAFFRGLKLPVMQKIFVLDTDGKEYSCVIDADYWLKLRRDENNLRKIRDLLLGLNKESLMSDWAEKR